ncbi:MAG TPA: GDP-mannose 4,6-dehydratase [bacterium]|mgnify:FL=1|nr:GDP-mannose 4,6-dehydratase [bacterium]HPG84201.1 GDP-mannose 4,6-dehydratase [bacterium]HPM58638.1 GDP-mannose 4,6-dehydratase [bacterium]
MHLLLTGGAGFIGSHFSRKLLDEGHEVDCLDNFNTYYDPALKRENVQPFLDHPRYRLIEGDIVDWPAVERLFAERSYDSVVHLAARAGVRPSIREPLLYEQVNVLGTMHILEAARQHGVGRIVSASSSSVYGSNSKVPFSESDPVDHPISPYAATKKAGELMAFTWHHLYGLSISCMRFFTVYGPRQRPDMAIHKFARLICSGQPVPVFGDGRSRRDYTYIDDIIAGLYAALLRCEGYHIYNLGESNTIELLELIHLLEEGLGRKAVLEFHPDQPGDVPITYADISLARRELDYRPSTPIERGIGLFAEWYKSRHK